MNKLKYSRHPIWSATLGSKLIFKYDSDHETLVQSFVIEVYQMYEIYIVSMLKTNGFPFYREYVNKKQAIEYLCEYLKYYGDESREIYENTEINILELVRTTQGKKAAERLCIGVGSEVSTPRSLKNRLSLNLTPRLTRSDPYRNKRFSTPRSSRLRKSKKLQHFNSMVDMNDNNTPRVPDIPKPPHMQTEEQRRTQLKQRWQKEMDELDEAMEELLKVAQPRVNK